MLLNPFSQLGTTIIIKSVGKAAAFYLFYTFSPLGPMLRKTLMFVRVLLYTNIEWGDQGF